MKKTGIFQNNLRAIGFAAAGLFLVVSLLLTVNTNLTAEDIARKNAKKNGEFWKEFSLTDLSGKEYTEDCFREADLTLVNGWAPWCGPCVAELPDLNEMAGPLAEEGIRILTIVADYGSYTGENQKAYDADVASVITEKHLTLPVLLPDKDFDQKIASGMTAFPTSWIVDSEGNLLLTVVGSRSREEWTDLLRRLKE